MSPLGHCDSHPRADVRQICCACPHADRDWFFFFKKILRGRLRLPSSLAISRKGALKFQFLIHNFTFNFVSDQIHSFAIVARFRSTTTYPRAEHECKSYLTPAEEDKRRKCECNTLVNVPVIACYFDDVLASGSDLLSISSKLSTLLKACSLCR